jgi:hypothetical protein
MKSLLMANLIAALALLAGAAVAEPSLRQRLDVEARAAFDRGVALYDAKDARGALAQFQLAYDKSREPRLLINLAVVERDLGRYARGLSLLERAQSEGGKSLSAGERAKLQRSIRAFRALTTEISVTTDPPGAEVLVDGELIGKTPLAAGTRIDLGRRKLSLRAEGHKDHELTREITGPLRLELSLEPLLRKGRLRVEVTPADVPANVLVDDVNRGTTPLEIEVEEGVRRVTVRRAGFVDETRAIDVQHRVRAQLAFRLRRDAAFLSVKGVNAGSEVLLDGRRLARGDFEGKVRTGPRRLEVRRGEALVYSTEINLRPGERRSVFVDDRGSNWGYWAAGGLALVAAAVTSALLLSQEESAPDSVGTAGTLNPNRVSVPASR